MKIKIFVAVLALSAACFAQAVRFDTVLSSGTYVNGVKVSSPLGGATMNICTAPANATPCTNYATIYTDSTATTTATNPVTADSNGNAGFWALHGQYQYTYTYKAQSFGPYSVTLGGGASYIDARDYGFAAGGADNYAAVAALNTAVSTPASAGIGRPVIIPATLSTGPTYYYFSKQFDLNRSMNLSCDAAASGNTGVYLVFAKGVNGLVWQSGTATGSDGGNAKYGSVNGCGVVSLGHGTATFTNTSASITALSTDSYGPIAATGAAAGDGIIAWKSGGTTPLVPPGAYLDSVSGSVGSQGATLHAGFEATASSTAGVNNNAIYLLAAANTITASLNGTSTVTTSAGPCAYPGDMIWSPGFPFGATVFTASGACGAQTLTITTQFGAILLNASTTATVKMWTIPAGLKRYIAGNADMNYVLGFPVGLSMSGCSSGNGLNCTESIDMKNWLALDIAGRWVSGNNTGGSISIGNQYFRNYFNDIMEGGTVGSFYSDNSNSGAISAAWPVVGDCEHQNFSIFDGMYIDQGFNGPWNYCITIDGGGSVQNGPTFAQPQAAYPADAMVSHGNEWLGGNRTLINLAGGTATSGTNDALISLGGNATQIGEVLGIDHKSSDATDFLRWIYDRPATGNGWLSMYTLNNAAGSEAFAVPDSRAAATARAAWARNGWYFGNYTDGTQPLFNFVDAAPGTCVKGSVYFKRTAAAGSAAGWFCSATNTPVTFGLVANDNSGTNYTVGGVTLNAGTISGVGNSSAGKAMCWKTTTTLGYCSTQPDATGACTCN